MKRIELTPDTTVEALLQMLDDDEIVLTRGGNAVAILSDYDDDEPYWQARENDPEFIASIAEAREEIKRGKGIPLEQVKKELGME